MYQLTNQENQVKRLADNAGARTECCAFIPFDPANTDYQAYLAWLAEGNEPLAADAALPSDSVADEPTQE